MKKSQIKLNEIKLVGITTRTNNEAEMNSQHAKIGKNVELYFKNNLAKQIPHRKSPGKTYCVYTNYTSDENGEYTYFIGEEVKEVSSFTYTLESDKNIKFETLLIPSQTYAKFTTDSGVRPDVCINAWQNIWQMDNKDFGGKRAYIADIEIYDERAKDYTNTILDIYIGIEKSN